MNKHRPLQLTGFIVAILLSFSTYAWDHSLSLGYGTGQDTNHTHDTNSGFLISANLFPLVQRNWWNCMFNASLGNWYSSFQTNKHVTTGALSLSFRLYYLPFLTFIRPYLLAESGPALLSNRRFGQNTQGSNAAFQTNAAAGFEFADSWDLNIRWVHYSNAGIFKPNEGFNFLYVVSLGYLF